VTAQQINSAVDALFARAADPEGPAILWYALRLQQLPFALIGVGLMNALLPPLSRASEEDEYLELLGFSMKKIAIFMIPLTFAIFAGGFSGVNLLYGRGAFSELATYETTLALFAYALSLLPMAWTLLLASAFYAKKEYKIPTLCSLLSIAANIALNACFVYLLHMGSVSIALATALASFLNVALLTHFLSQKRRGYGKGLPKITLECVFVGLLSALAAIAVSGVLVQDNTSRLLLFKTLLPFPRVLTAQLLQCFVAGGVFLGTLMVLASLFRIEELLTPLRRLIPVKKRV
jgi:putative peptidoglycan lipid II flippase